MIILFIFSRVALNMTGLSIPAKIQRCRFIVLQMTGNPVYTTPDPTLVIVTAAIDALEDSYEAALNKDTVKKQQMYADEKELDDLMVRLSAYVQTVSNGDDLKILSTGMDVKKKSTPVGPLSPPESFKAKTGTLTGTIDFAWKSVAKANGYVFEYTEDPIGTAPWIKIEALTKASITVDGLVPGKNYWGRASAFNTSGTTNPSDPAMARAL